MSGGYFDHKQFHIQMIVEEIQQKLDNQGTLKPTQKLMYDWEDRTYQTYSEEVQKQFREAVRALQIAKIYAQRIDYFLSGDDGEENFLLRLDKELKEFDNK